MLLRNHYFWIVFSISLFGHMVKYCAGFQVAEIESLYLLCWLAGVEFGTICAEKGD